MKMKRWRLWGLMIALALAMACQPAQRGALPAPVPNAPARDKLRLFWVNSYAGEDVWSQQVRTGVLETLARSGYTLVEGTLEMETFNMEVQQIPMIDVATPAANRAVEKIQASQPDLVVVVGDVASRAVIPRYPDRSLPFVLCGFVGDPAVYGLNLPNVTGVLEALHPVQTVAMAYAFVEDAQQYMILSDGSVAGKARALSAYSVLGQSEYGASASLFRMVETWSRWQTTVLEDARAVDFILLASYQGVVDDTGALVDEKEVLAWMQANSPVPVFALSDFAIVNGAVGGLVSYGYEEGVSVGEIVVRLAAGESPSDIEIRGPERNLLAVNLAAVHHWNLRIPITFPLAARIYSTLPASQGGR
ncbi:MAG TPA: ABC transporter substrate binding protein [Anaerolineae bacterium]|nr:ABC transporter substrate binding protein [Anaerolineae bacterium]HQH37060.1 ABC transporter substrate binding protein [Anaerolineae bacterium]